ncbi:hypothetical protein AWZ03_001856 [Drosophila navojoa]|uniref:Uncharacterized protein n=1 Tax=Drosophila navojoa TaxID=7232 RepID=A0A484BSJ6_DRONA|nr:hypothetical protein AWZ03_001856 [Drosophila navojoa]
MRSIQIWLQAASSEPCIVHHFILHLRLELPSSSSSPSSPSSSAVPCEGHYGNDVRGRLLAITQSQRLGNAPLINAWR